MIEERKKIPQDGIRPLPHCWSAAVLPSSSQLIAILVSTRLSATGTLILKGQLTLKYSKQNPALQNITFLFHNATGKPVSKPLYRTSAQIEEAAANNPPLVCWRAPHDSPLLCHPSPSRTKQKCTDSELYLLPTIPYRTTLFTQSALKFAPTLGVIVLTGRSLPVLARTGRQKQFSGPLGNIWFSRLRFLPCS